MRSGICLKRVEHIARNLRNGTNSVIESVRFGDGAASLDLGAVALSHGATRHHKSPLGSSSRVKSKGLQGTGRLEKAYQGV